MVCENCLSPHDGTYASGRFCSSKCSRSYSTKSKRALINEKVSVSLRKTHGTDFHTCPSCKSQFEWKHFAGVAAKLGMSETKFCSESCKLDSRRSQNLSPSFRQKMSNAAIRRLEKGEVWFGKRVEAEFRGKKINCDSLLEKSFILYLERDNNVLDVNRSNVWIEYSDEGITRRYNPDFIIDHVDGSQSIAEVKSERVGKNDVWEDYRKKSIIKFNLLNDYAKSQGMKCLWYTQKTSPADYKEAQKKI